MGILDSLQQKESIQSKPPQVTLPSPESKRTVIEQGHFSIRLPFTWHAVAPDQPLEFEFRNQQIPEQLLVTTLLAKVPLTSAQITDVAEQLLARRREGVSGISEGRATFAFPTYQTKYGHFEVRCSATMEAQNIEHAWVTRVAPAKLVTAALTRYTRAQIGVPFSSYAGIVFDSLKVNDPELIAI